MNAVSVETGGLAGSSVRVSGVTAGSSSAATHIASHACMHADFFSSQHESSLIWCAAMLSIDDIADIGPTHIACVASAGIGAASANIARIKRSKRFMNIHS